MAALHVSLVLVHLLALGAVVYGAVSQLNRAERRITPAVVWGAVVQLLTGLALVGVLEADDADVNHAKIGVKLLVALAVVGIAHGRRRRTPVTDGVLLTLLALEAVNVVVALAW